MKQLGETLRWIEITETERQQKNERTKKVKRSLRKRDTEFTALKLIAP